MLGLRPLVGHEGVRRVLAQALDRGQLPSALLLHGPAGIGKQRLALWFGQRVMCERPGPVEPCGDCRPCRQLLRLEHPDVHWFFPLPRPRASGGLEKLADALEQSRAAALADRRSAPWQASGSEELTGIYLAHVHVIRRIAAVKPSVDERRVFIIGDAEALVPQEASPEAANALLKLLEEPPQGTFIVLTAADPADLLPTLRSRLLPVAMRPLSNQEVEQALTEAGVDPATAARVAPLAQGSIGRALGFLPEGDEGGPLERVRAEARALLQAAVSHDASERFGAALAQSPAGARGAFAQVLEALSLWIRDLAATAAGATELVVNRDSIAWLQKLNGELPDAARSAPAAYDAVRAAAALAPLNVNPQLTLAALLEDLARIIRN